MAKVGVGDGPENCQKFLGAGVCCVVFFRCPESVKFFGRIQFSASEESFRSKVGLTQIN